MRQPGCDRCTIHAKRYRQEGFSKQIGRQCGQPSSRPEIVSQIPHCPACASRIGFAQRLELTLSDFDGLLTL